MEEWEEARCKLSFPDSLSSNSPLSSDFHEVIRLRKIKLLFFKPYKGGHCMSTQTEARRVGQQEHEWPALWRSPEEVVPRAPRKDRQEGTCQRVKFKGDR